MDDDLIILDVFDAFLLIICVYRFLNLFTAMNILNNNRDMKSKVAFYTDFFIIIVA